MESALGVCVCVCRGGLSSENHMITHLDAGRLPLHYYLFFNPICGMEVLHKGGSQDDQISGRNERCVQEQAATAATNSSYIAECTFNVNQKLQNR